MLELTDGLKAVFVDTAHQLKGSARRLFMARIVDELGPGGQRLAQRELGWNRDTLRKGAHELHSGLTCADAFHLRGRIAAEERLPHLLDDLRAIVDGQSQTDPQFRNNRLYTRLSVAEVRRQLVLQKGYQEADLPCLEGIRTRLTRMGYHPKTVKKSQPKKIAQTDAIFAHLSQCNPHADADPSVLRVSMDAKATVKVGDYSRGGKNRVQVQAADHDFHPAAQVTPVGLLLPSLDELTLYAVTSKVTSDCLADILEQWWQTNRARFTQVKTLLLNLDNGPECPSRRTQFLHRLVHFVRQTGLTLQLAYYLSYHHETCVLTSR